MYRMIEKTKVDRVQEAVTLLKKLPGAGIPTSHEVYIHINDSLSNWVKMGLPSSEIIDLGTHTGELVLPVVKGNDISFHMKAKK